MKIAIDIGHNVAPDGGAVGFGNENWMNTSIGTHLISMLKKAGVEVIACKPITASSVRDSLRKRVSKANAEKCDYYISIHHNAGKGKGCEVFYTSPDGLKLATPITNCISSLGFNNRGAKCSDEYFVLNHTKMPAVIVETCFVDTQSDVELWNKLGAEKIARAIYDGLNTALKFAK
ncbi:hypothetical protein CAL7716_072350 [Calothrix sp. PCC 7716]|nr:hypothetical protein CAL7716_072350 [Calothrix sp. PCC 7716]